jgi:peptidyl-prolyl cis-trans isomerase C
MKHIALPAALLLAMALVACGKKEAVNAPASRSEPVALVDGKPVSAELFDYYATRRARKPAAELTGEEKDQILDELIQLQLTAQAAEKAGYDVSDAETAGQLQYERLNVLANTAARKHLGDKEPTEQELRTEYETQLAEQPPMEYRARHILVATEGFAQNLIEQINGGAKFEDVARKHSMDGSSEQGGDLNWFKANQMVKPFSDAVIGLEKGEMTQKPVHTQFGWHIIRLDDTRAVTPPEFEQVRAGLANLVTQKKVQAYVNGLKKDAKIEKKLPAAKPEPAAGDAAKPGAAAAPAQSPPSG